MKPLPLAKTRLSMELSPSQRVAIGRNLLRRVLRAIKGVGPSLMDESRLESVLVVGGGADVSKVAQEEGASWCEEEGSDINESLQIAFQAALDSGKAAMFLPGDLPFLKPQDIYSLVGASGRLKSLILSPARQGGGTNGILVVPGLAQTFRPLLGPDSFRRHLSQATSLGISVAICYSKGLAFDLDTLEDLKAYQYMEPGLLESLTEGENPAQGKG